jgi:tetratricopeptide (TPR) repeat protein
LIPPLLALALVVGVQLNNSVQSGGASGSAPGVLDPRAPGAADAVPVTEVGPIGAVDTADVDRRIEFWRARADAHPQSEQEWVYIGDLLDLKGRLTGDVAEFIAAQDAYERAIQIAPNSLAAHSGSARIHATLHDFEIAVAEATLVLQLDPYANDALGVIFDASIELGNLDNARLALERLAARTQTPALFIREARLAFFSGDVQAAVELARKSVVFAEEADASTAVIAFYHFAVAEYELFAGNLDAAQAEFEVALEGAPGYTAAIYGMSRVSYARGDLVGAIALLESLPKTLSRPDMLAFTGDLYQLSGNTDAASEHHELADAAARSAAVGDRLIFGREYALFLADHMGDLGFALTLSPAAPFADGYGADTAAWVLYKAGRLEEALAAARAALAFGIADPLISIHAGLIEIAAGDPGTGRSLISEALKLNPTASPLVIDEARRALGG